MEAPPSPEEVVRRFMAAINARDLEGVLALMTDDHRFTDAAGASIAGREPLRAAWQGYFGWFPNYEITADEVFSRGQAVAVFGRAGGTFAPGVGSVAENTWRLPAAWLAEVRDGRIAHWRVYCDTEPVWAIMRRAGQVLA